MSVHLTLPTDTQLYEIQSSVHQGAYVCHEHNNDKPKVENSKVKMGYSSAEQRITVSDNIITCLGIKIKPKML